MLRVLEAGAGLEAVTEPVESIAPETPSGQVYERFRHHPDVAAIPVVDGTKPVGLVDRNHLTMSLAHRYGNALYAGKPG